MQLQSYEDEIKNLIKFDNAFMVLPGQGARRFPINRNMACAKLRSSLKAGKLIESFMLTRPAACNCNSKSQPIPQWWFLVL
jgi:hypothetical protein